MRCRRAKVNKMSTQKKRAIKKSSAGAEETSEVKGKQRSRRSYLQLKVNLSETTPTGVVILDALLSDDPKFLKRYGLGPKVTRANKLLWFAYLGITQGHMPGSEPVMESSPRESVRPAREAADFESPLPAPKVTAADELPLPALKVTKADEDEEEDEALDEGTLMAGLID